jgi:hypothetical protein
VGVLALSLLVDHTWPMRYLHMIAPYQGSIPALTLPLGPLLLLAALRWHDERARLFLVMVLMPQRTVYDFLALWLVPATMRWQLALSLLSWVVVIAGIPTWPAILSTPDMQWAIHILYIPVLVLVLRENRPVPGTIRRRMLVHAKQDHSKRSSHHAP